MSKGISNSKIENALKNIWKMRTQIIILCVFFHRTIWINSLIMQPWYQEKRESDTATNFFYFIQAFGNKLKLRDSVNIWIVENRVQDLNSETYGIFQLYFNDNFFNPDEKYKTQNKTRLNKRTIETLLNELFVLDDQETN